MSVLCDKLWEKILFSRRILKNNLAQKRLTIEDMKKCKYKFIYL